LINYEEKKHDFYLELCLGPQEIFTEYRLPLRAGMPNWDFTVISFDRNSYINQLPNVMI
jgi:hypothetical protein